MTDPWRHDVVEGRNPTAESTPSAAASGRAPGTLEIQPGVSVVEELCGHCGQEIALVTGFVYRDGDAYAVYYASCHQVDGPEVWIDGVFSPTWADGVDDHLTFGCRVGCVDGGASCAASLVDAASAWGESPEFGHKLSRQAALEHRLLDEFWALVDHVLVHDVLVRNHLFGPNSRRHS